MWDVSATTSTDYYIGEKSNHLRKEGYLYGITEEMCTSDYWKDKNFIDIDEILMNYDDISTLNQKIVDASGTMVFDLESFKETFDANARKQSLQNADIPTRDLYIKGSKIDNEEYFTKLLVAIKETGYSGEQNIKYGICSNRTDIKSWPTDDVIGYSATDSDDEMESSAMNVNEPFIIQAKCDVGKNTYYWGYSNNCTGWVNSKNVAICTDKNKWLDFWKIDTDEDNFVVVTGSRITLKNTNSDNIDIMLGTILKLVPEDKVPEQLASYYDTNYIVYFAGNDENGLARTQYAILSKNLELNKGFLSLTQSNVLDVAFSCIGDEYGWGGMNGNMDCSLYTRSIYKCFGFELPRNTTWQQKIPDKFLDISKMDDINKANYISTLPAGSLLYFPGHTMVYIGMDKNKNFVVSDLGSVADEPEGSVVESVYAVTVNSLNVKRANGTTWLRNLNGVVSFAKPIDISDCDIEIENQNFVYDGNEKKPNVKITYKGKTIYPGASFEIEYLNNIEIGTATIKIIGVNNFTGSITKTFEIKESEKNEEPKEDEKPQDDYEEEKQDKETTENKDDKEVKKDTDKKDEKEQFPENSEEIPQGNIIMTYSPNTGDSISIYFITLIISFVFICLILIKKKNN